MEQGVYSVITGSGSYIPTRRILNEDFLSNVFYERGGARIEKNNEDIIRQFGNITGIEQRRYVTDELMASDIAFFAARNALQSSGIDPETIDYIIVAHNFGDIPSDNRRSEMVPSLASKVKNHLQIRNPYTVGFDLIFGCAGWLQGVIQADIFIRSGLARRVMVIGAETLSRVCDPHDRDGMIYADGAGAVIIEGVKSDLPVGVVAHTSKSYTDELAYVLQMGASFNPEYIGHDTFLKMNGRKLYEAALKTVPVIIKECIDKLGLTARDISKILIHQANEKMDEAILSRLFALYGLENPPKEIMPMTISWLGNSSVATLPTLYDLISKGDFENQAFGKGSHIVFVSLGAGINMNVVVYKIP
ncbi:3-oxoacyl-ACP synthase III family protein [Dyadobacter frigoris]|uniref:Ketoacyl-ACP synthase III n=1 Tax=Dyadobacter frigoris TaxID=2576211 RepID=A0A4U6CYB9_9BACT|nr:ketoacyl-ACP synthase III [Dyadobacter frigoris]TKT88855.1 ketoacyl-ACP synthase III [Dyadobacter frigoris]GLU56045.1 3-oxoacyl-ACP synthase [Dyadobacter frigoris]